MYTSSIIYLLVFNHEKLYQEVGLWLSFLNKHESRMIRCLFYVNVSGMVEVRWMTRDLN